MNSLPIRLNNPHNHTTFIERHIQNGGDGVVYADGTNVMELWEGASGVKRQYATMPLAVMNENGTVAIPSDAVGMEMVVYTDLNGNQHSLGIKSSKTKFSPHADFVKSLSAIGRNAHSIVFSKDGGMVMVQYEMETIDVFGEPIRHVLVISNKVMGGTQVMMTAVPLFCTNQLPVLAGGKNGSMGYGNNSIAVCKVDSIIEPVRNLLSEGSQRVTGLYNTLYEISFKDKFEVTNVLRKIYPSPKQPTVSLENVDADGNIHASEKWQAWTRKNQEVRDIHETVFGVMQNATGTHNNDARGSLNGYSLVQAVAEVATHHPNNKWGSDKIMTSWLGGNNSGTVNTAMQEVIRHATYGGILRKN